MKKTLIAVSVAALLGLAGTAAQAQHNHGSHGAKPTATQSKAGSTSEMADGEIRRVDKAKGTVLLKHGEIKSLNMSPMTMGFKLQDPKMAEGLNPGDKVRFVAIQKGDDLIVTNILKVQ